MKLPVLIRHSKPTKYDQAPQGSTCKVLKVLCVEYELYKQISSDDENPYWELIGTFSDDSCLS